MTRDHSMIAVRTVTIIASLAIAVYVALHPTLVYRPTSQAVLFLLVSCLPAILFAAEAASRFDLKLPGFAASAGGAAAIVFICLLLLDHIAAPEQYVAVYHVYDAQDQPVQGLDREGAVEVPPVEGGFRVSSYVDGNTIILIFPEQVAAARLRIRPILGGPAQEFVVSYAGTTERTLRLKELEP